MSPDNPRLRSEKHGVYYDVTVNENHTGMGTGRIKTLMSGLTFIAQLRIAKGTRLFDVGLQQCISVFEQLGNNTALDYIEANRPNGIITFGENEVRAERR